MSEILRKNGQALHAWRGNIQRCHTRHRRRAFRRRAGHYGSPRRTFRRRIRCSRSHPVRRRSNHFIYNVHALSCACSGKSEARISYLRSCHDFFSDRWHLHAVSSVTLRARIGWTLFGILWGLAITGIVFDAIMLDRFRKIEMILYVAMGWCIIFASKSVLASLASTGFILLLAGGLCYTVGIVFYAMKTVRYMHSIWHLFVLAGSICHYFSVMLYVL